jgi:hypothetical protein
MEEEAWNESVSSLKRSYSCPVGREAALAEDGR